MFANVPLAYVLWAFFGLFGAHRFYVGRWESGLVYLFTFGGCFVGWIIDGFILPQLVEDVSYLVLLFSWEFLMGIPNRGVRPYPLHQLNSVTSPPLPPPIRSTTKKCSTSK